MENIKRKKELTLLKINRARVILAGELERKFITEKDIIKLFSKSNNYRLINNHDYKENVLKNIINSPFILCDQDNLNLTIKKLLPFLLKNRYEAEIDELYSLHELGDITEDELLESKELLKFSYYESSEDGKSILKNGKVKCVKDNVIRSR